MPISVDRCENRVILDFGSNYVGYLQATARGTRGDVVLVRCGQELNEDGTVRYKLRANCNYEEEWVLDTQNFRKSILVSSTLILLYNLVVGAYSGVLNECISLCSAGIGIFRYIKKQKTDNKI